MNPNPNPYEPPHTPIETRLFDHGLLPLRTLRTLRALPLLICLIDCGLFVHGWSCGVLSTACMVALVVIVSGLGVVNVRSGLENQR